MFRKGAGSVLVMAVGVVSLGCSVPLSRSTGYLDGYPAFVDHHLVNAVVEIPAGTNDKWEVEKTSGGLHWEKKDGKPRVVQYLGYPANYGMIPRTSLPETLGGDGDPLDVVVLGPAADRGSVVRARPIGVLRLLDDGERDDKIIAVPLEGPLSDAVDLDSLDSRYPGIRQILETWFTHYKGPGRITSDGFGNVADAMAVVQEASTHFEGALRSSE